MNPDLDNWFSRLDGMTVPGGCDKCNAIQVMKKYAQNLHILEIQHDEWCPFLQEHQRKNKRGK